MSGWDQWTSPEWPDQDVPEHSETRTFTPPSGLDEEVLRAAVREINLALDDQIEADIDPALAQELIAREIRAWIESHASSGRHLLTGELQTWLMEAVYNERFRLGALQPLLEDPDIENIDVNGCDRVWITYSDGHKERGAPVADSDERLVELIRRHAAYGGQTSREFSNAKPRLRLALPDGSRLTAVMAVSPRPCLSIRRHRMLDVTLDQLIKNGTLDKGLCQFLRAAIRARKDIVVTGGIGAGKTTFVRALASEFAYAERIVTVENEYELYLHTLEDRFGDIVPLEARQANTEGTGAITVRELVDDSLRLNARRIIVGEVLGDELIPMLTAMNTGGAGSLCTMHADSASEVFARMLILAHSGGLGFPPATLYKLVGMAVDFVVHLSHDVRHEQGHPVNLRYVSEVIEVLPPGDTEEPDTNHVYAPGEDGRAVPRTFPKCAADLVAAGFEPRDFAVPAEVGR